MPEHDGHDIMESIMLGPDCTIRSIGLAYDALRACRASAEVLRVDCGGVEHADVTLVQLLVSADATFAARDIRLAVDPVSACVRGAFDRSGVALPGAGHPASA